MKLKLVLLAVFSVAFAFDEAATVVYIRNITSHTQGYSLESFKYLINLGFISFVESTNKGFSSGLIGRTEVLREISTIIMLLSLSYIMGKNTRQKIGVFLISFGLWDIFYYVFLNLLSGWPRSLFDLDVYFLIPVAWIGPVITPIVISLILVLLGIKLFVFNQKVSN